MFYATDIANFLACEHITTLENEMRAGYLRKPYFEDPSVDLLRKMGLEHEQAHLRHLTTDQGLDVIEISADLKWREGLGATEDAMRLGAAAIYQATLQDGALGGKADFLMRVDRPSDLGFWSYEPVETKLARSTKAGAIIQLCFYSQLLERIQGVAPEWMTVVLGGSIGPERFLYSRYAAYFRKVKREFERAAGGTYPEPVRHCRVCAWSTVCDDRWRSEDSLVLVADISRSQRKALSERHVRTMAALGAMALPLEPRFDRIGEAALLRIRDQAGLQVQGRTENRPVHQLLEPIEPERGLAALPEPSAGDIFLDFESDPYVLEGGLEYLFGYAMVRPDKRGNPVYECLWALNRISEKAAFQTFIAWVLERQKAYPDLHIYHYAPYEQTALKRLAGRHAVCGDELDNLLRGGVFVDLYRVVRQSLRASVESYSIKKLEPFYRFNRAVPLKNANQALGAFGAALTLGAEADEIVEFKSTIQGYNQDDCLSAYYLRQWLESLRKQVEKTTGAEVPRPATKDAEPNENLAEYLSEVQKVAGQLTAGIPSDEKAWTEEHRARLLLANLLEWHRREEKSAWWEYYRLRDLTDEELERDKTALARLEYVGLVGTEKKSSIHRYKYPPQDHTIKPDHDVRDPKTGGSPGKVVAFDDHNCTIDLKRGATSAVSHPAALIPFDIVPSKVKRESVLRIGKWIAENGFDKPGPYRAGRDLLLRNSPRLRGRGFEEVFSENPDVVEAAKLMARLLDETVLPIQGPPGAGKTHTASHMIVELVRGGARVGITAVSHKVISNLLEKVCELAAKTGGPMGAIQKADTSVCVDHPSVTAAKDNADVLDALVAGTTRIAAGTAWLWAREEMAEVVDVLFVDEAGQMSLADVLAVSQAAKSLVLLGDPQQLDQPQRGVHPPGAEASALAHLLGENATIPDDHGLFLAETWRLHPDVCAFISELFYENRLVARPENRTQRLNARGHLDGTGLRLVPVEHTGNQSESVEEAERVAELVNTLLSDATTWTDKKGETQPLKLEDILVVSPYNAQVAALKDILPPGSRVGTVDKFQGQEAPVVIYSMTTSSPEDAPRGMEFLYSLNRLNVAVSRAQCVAVIVASPALFQVHCNTPRQMELANAFCRYLELARRI